MAKLFAPPAHPIVSGSYSWSGKTLVLHGKDMGAPNRGEYAGFVWRTKDDGDTFVDETGDLVTMAVNQGSWFGEDFYLTTSGEGILRKSGLDSLKTDDSVASSAPGRVCGNEGGASSTVCSLPPWPATYDMQVRPPACRRC